MRAAEETCTAAGVSDAGRQRLVNEDRCYVDARRGVFIVVDGVGGQAAGGRAADTALDVVRTRLTAGAGDLASRLREAITAANNEIYRQAALRPEWQGMACVLTAAVIDGARLVVGHVGDTRLYTLRSGALTKITSDHSPVGEREDAGEIAEFEAMRHPRRNEVYRDVGSEPHGPDDPGFIEVREVSWQPDAALLLCSDGLTDLVPADEIRRTLARHAGRPQQAAEALVRAANDAGGRDNVTIVYVEGPAFARASAGDRASGPASGRAALLVAAAVLAAVLAAGWRASGYAVPAVLSAALVPAPAGVIVVNPGESLAAALAAAPPGATIHVEPGEYRERLTLRSGVRLLSRVSRGAVLRLPDTASEADVAVTAVDVIGAELSGFTIVGDAATPLGTGVLVRSAGVRLFDLDVSGAADAAIDLGPGGEVVLAASDVHDNPGVALAVRADAAARIRHNEFRGNGASDEGRPPIALEPGAQPHFRSNVFRDVDPHSLAGLDDAARAALAQANVFTHVPLAPATTAPAAAAPRGRRR